MSSTTDAARPVGEPDRPVFLGVDGGGTKTAFALVDAHGDVLAFENRSTHAMHVEFTEPKDLIDKIRCGAVRDAKDKGTPTAPWALFTWDGGKLSANVPPGQFASVCSLAAGHYAFTANGIGNDPGGKQSGVLPAKGQIDVK